MTPEEIANKIVTSDEWVSEEESWAEPFEIRHKFNEIQYDWNALRHSISDAIKKTILEEREACADIAKQMPCKHTEDGLYQAEKEMAARIMTSILARGEDDF